MSTRPDDGLFGIKIILPPHLDIPHLTHDYGGPGLAGQAAERRTLMNFPDDERSLAIASNIPVGHRSLVYCTQRGGEFGGVAAEGVGGFVWAIKYVGTLEDGRRAAAAHGLGGTEYGRWNVMRPIRIIARIHDRARAAKPADLLARTGIEFSPNSFTHAYITREKYERLHAAIAWDWVASD